MGNFDFEEWNRTNNWLYPHKIDERDLKSYYLYQVIKSKVDGKFYAFENKNLLSLVGTQSYKTALRNHIIHRIDNALMEGDKCGIATFNGAWGIDITHIDNNNFESFCNNYFYKNLMQKYGLGNWTWELHQIIDDWNQVSSCGSKDITKINPHDIRISPNHELTIQEFFVNHNYGFNLTHGSKYFVNGIPIDSVLKVERIINDGLVIKENQRIAYHELGSLNVICDYIELTNSHILYSDKGRMSFYEKEPLEKRLVKTLKESVNNF